MILSLPRLIELLKQNKNIVMVNAGAIVSILILFLYFFIFPLQKEINKLKPIKESNEKTVAVQKTLVNNGKLKSGVEKLNIAIPENPDILKIGSSIQTLAIKNELFLKSLSFSQTGVKENISGDILGVNVLNTAVNAPAETVVSNAATQQEVPVVSANAVSFSVEVAGNQDNLKKFLQNLEMNLRLIDVEDIKMPGNSQSSNNDYRLELKTYYLPLNMQ